MKSSCGTSRVRVVLIMLAMAAGGHAAFGQRVYWAQSFGERIRRAHLDGTNVQTLVEPPVSFEPVAIRIDRPNGKLYWAETFENTIRRANLEGTNIETLLEPPALIDPNAIALDGAGKVYWSQTIDDGILRANLDGTGVQTIVAPPNSFDVVSIAVDPFASLIYWAENPGDRIRVANLDGTNPQTFLDVIFVSDPVAIAVDEATGEVYWAEGGNNRIRRSDGLSVSTVVDSVFVTDPVALALVSPARKDYTGALVYWAEGATSRIRVFDPEAGVDTIVEAPSVFDPVSIDVDPGPVGAPPAPQHSATPNDSTRFLSIVVPPDGLFAAPTALRVRLVDLQNPVPPNPAGQPPPNYSAYEQGASCSDPAGCARWVGPPRPYLEFSSVPGLGSYMASRLQCTPYYFDWSGVGVLNIFGAEIAPSSQFDVENLSESCAGVENSCLAVSLPLRVTTRRYGDVAAPFNPPSTAAQPDGLDIASLVDKFKGLQGAPKAVRALIQPNVPDPLSDVSALDVAGSIDAFKGFAYPFSGPCPCPSPTPCNVVSCTIDSQCASGTCVRVCLDGTYDGQICKNASHCPGGACGGGFCRDRCRRCTP